MPSLVPNWSRAAPSILKDFGRLLSLGAILLCFAACWFLECSSMGLTIAIQTHLKSK